jgi:predicted metal-binding membrane protein
MRLRISAAGNGESIVTTPTSLSNGFESGFFPIARPRVVSEQASRRVFFGFVAMLFTVCAAVTIVWCSSMSAQGGMAMPGGWTMSMAWMRMPGQSWPGATASFVAMWVVMMAAMMLPSLAPTLWRYRQAVSWTGESRRTGLTALSGLGYFFVWTLLGLAAFPAGVGIAAIEMEQPMLARVVPMAAGLVVLIAGAIQFTKWKAHHLTRCRQAPERNSLPAHTGAAWTQGLHFGFHCGLSCANLTAILLVLGVMDLRAMAAVTAAITAERLAPAGERAARIVGLVAIGIGVLTIGRAVALEWRLGV